MLSSCCCDVVAIVDVGKLVTQWLTGRWLFQQTNSLEQLNLNATSMIGIPKAQRLVHEATLRELDRQKGEMQWQAVL